MLQLTNYQQKYCIFFLYIPKFPYTIITLMSIQPKGEKKWVINYYPLGAGGKHVQQIFYGTESEARAAELEARRKCPTPRNTINPKIKDIMPQFLDWLKMHRAEKTYDDVKLSLTFILPHSGHLQVPRITPTIIDQYKKIRAGRPSATNKELNYLRSIIKFMVKNNFANPLDFCIEMVPYKAPLPNIPHLDDIEKFFEEVKDPIKKSMVLFMWQCGLRYKEMKNIRWENINWKTSVITLTETKGSAPRKCLLPEAIRALLQPLKKYEGYAFENHISKSSKTIITVAECYYFMCRKSQSVGRRRPIK